MPFPSRSQRAAAGPALVFGLLAAALLIAACQEPAGPPPTLASGTVAFSFSGRYSGTFTAEGRCYWSTGYPAADSACSLALDLGDTIRIRGVRDPRMLTWQHVNVEFPENGSCVDPDACRIALVYLNAAGVVERTFRSSEADVTVLEESEERMRGTFTGRAYEVGGDVGDTIRIVDGVFDLPVER